MHTSHSILPCASQRISGEGSLPISGTFDPVDLSKPSDGSFIQTSSDGAGALNGRLRGALSDSAGGMLPFYLLKRSSFEG